MDNIYSNCAVVISGSGCLKPLEGFSAAAVNNKVSRVLLLLIALSFVEHLKYVFHRCGIN